MIDDYELWNQLVRRVRRSGNKAKRVFLHSLVAVDTVDEAIVARTEKKGGSQKELLDALRAYTIRRRAALRYLRGR